MKGEIKMRNEKINVMPSEKEERSYILFAHKEDLKLIDKENEIYMLKERKDAYVHTCGCAIAMAINFSFDGIIYKAIVCDSSFDRLPKYVQKFIVLHEIGHHVNGDGNLSEKEKLRALAGRTIGILPKMKVNADKYAYSVMGEKAKSALKFLLCRTNVKFIAKTELMKRIMKIDR